MFCLFVCLFVVASQAMQPSTTYQLGRKQTTHRTGRGLPFAVEFAAVAVVVAVDCCCYC